MRRIARWCGVLAMVWTANAAAQETPLRDIVGRISGPDGAGIPLVLVRATQGEFVREARTDSLGQYRIVGTWAGRWLVTARRLGYAADSSTVTVADAALRHDRVLVPLVPRIGAQVITAAWSGVHGVVGDRNYQPVADASVEVVGRNRGGTTNADGSFALPQLPGTPLLLRIRAPGFEPRLVSALVPASGNVELSVLLDAQQGEGPSRVLEDELEMRMAWSSPLSAYLTRAEVLAAETRDLRVAIELAPTVNRKGLRVTRAACVFVDGVARPSLPLDMVDPDRVEFIEIYAGAADRSGLLARRWPPRAECGAGGSPLRSAGNAQVVQFVVIWTRRE